MTADSLVSHIRIRHCDAQDFVTERQRLLSTACQQWGTVSSSVVIGLVIFNIVLAAGQLLFKRSGLSMRGHSLHDGFIILLREPAIYAAIILYASATLLWIWLLSHLPLTQAYPWIALSVVVVPFLAVVIYGETVSPIFWVGTILIAAGIIVTQYGVPPH